MDSAAIPAMTGVVLAGGRSRRMGRDKALLVVDGEPLVERVARRLAAVCDTVVVASGARPLDGLEYAQVADAVPGRGPLGGIVAALEACATHLAAVVAVDMPFADPAVLSLLAASWDGEPAVIPVVGGRLQPLHAVYATGSADAFRRCLESGRLRLTEVARRVGAREADHTVWGGADPTGSFATNINRPEDLAGVVTTIAGRA